MDTQSNKCIDYKLLYHLAAHSSIPANDDPALFIAR
jgi:hypothetical protein